MVGKEVRVLLYHGRVSVLDRTAPAPAGKELQLEPGQEMIASVGAGAPPTLVSFDPERSSSWEAVRALTGWGSPLAGRLAIVDMLERRWRAGGLPADPARPVFPGLRSTSRRDRT